jgi:NAD(P)-dependent dehydrogenase (short-subunit alcohol dehydrogenase family)
MDDRVALFSGGGKVTYGSKGLGYALGLKLAESGAEIALLARNQAEVKYTGGYVTGTFYRCF